MKRKALIIANPGEPGEDYCSGVEKDVHNYTAFLQSPIGGLWRDDEMTVLWQPRRRVVRAEIEVQRTADHRVGVSRGLRDRLGHVPVLDDFAAFQAEDVHHRLSVGLSDRPCQ
jgi:hypothetical protein